MKVIKALIAANIGLVFTDCLCIAAKEPLVSELLMKEHKDKRINYAKGVACVLMAPAIIASEALQKSQPVELDKPSKVEADHTTLY